MTIATAGLVSTADSPIGLKQSAALAQLPPYIKAAKASGDDIGQQDILKLHDTIFERELTLLQPLQQHAVGNM